VLQYGWHLFHKDEYILNSKYKSLLQLAIATQIIESYYTRSESREDLINGIRATYYFRNYFKEYISDGIDLSIFNKFINIFYEHLYALSPNKPAKYTKLFHRIMENRLIRPNQGFKSIVSFINGCFKSDNISLAKNEIVFLKRNIRDLKDLKYENPKDFIVSIGHLFDIINFYPDIFHPKDSDFLVQNVLDANDFLRKHYSFDIPLFIWYQRKMLSLDMASDLSSEIVTKENLIISAKRSNLFNELRQIKQAGLIPIN